jgi:hypothetical protein
MEYQHSPAVSMIMSKILMADAVRTKSRIFQFDVSGAFLQAGIRLRIVITLPKVYAEGFPEFKEYGDAPFMLVKAMRDMALSGNTIKLLTILCGIYNVSHLPCNVHKKRRKWHTRQTHCIH